MYRGCVKFVYKMCAIVESCVYGLCERWMSDVVDVAVDEMCNTRKILRKTGSSYVSSVLT